MPEAKLLYAVERGAGAPLVLIHGAGTSHQVWRRVQRRLARERRVVAIDLPGYGGSAPVGRGFELAEVADRAVEGLDERRIGRRFDLVGHSLGGAVATLIAARHPHRIARLVLVAPAGLAALPPGTGTLLGLAAAPFARYRRWLGVPTAGIGLARRLSLAGLAYDGSKIPAEDARALLRCSAQARRLGPGLAAAARADLRAELESLEVDFGLIWGANDPVVPTSRIARVLELRPDTPVRVIGHAAHAPQFDRPAEFCAALSELLEQLGPGPGAAGPDGAGRRPRPAPRADAVRREMAAQRGGARRTTGQRRAGR